MTEDVFTCTCGHAEDDHFHQCINDRCYCEVTITSGTPVADLLGTAMDMVDEEDALVGVLGRGRKVDRILARYIALERKEHE
jgi:site-specific recombinase XerC